MADTTQDMETTGAAVSVTEEEMPVREPSLERAATTAGGVDVMAA